MHAYYFLKTKIIEFLIIDLRYLIMFSERIGYKKIHKIEFMDFSRLFVF
jgi:hypothetical protein